MSEEALKAACRLQYSHHYWEHVPGGPRGARATRIGCC